MPLYIIGVYVYNKIAILIFIIFSSVVISNEAKLNLKGLVFVNDYRNLTETSLLEGINFKSFTPPNKEALTKDMSQFLGRRVSMDLIEQIQKNATLHLRKNSITLVDVTIVANQDISNGIIQVLVTEGKVSDIYVSGNKYFSDCQILKSFSLKKGDIVDEATIKEDMFWINQSPYRSVDIIYEQGNDPGTTNIELLVKDERPFKAYAGYDLNEYQIAGESRFTFGVNAGNLFWNDQQLNLQIMSATTFSDWSALSGSYIIPLPWRHEFKTYGSYVKSKPDKNYTTLEEEGYRLEGKFWQVGNTYKVPLPIISSYYHNAQLTYDFKRTNNFLSISENLVQENYIDISQFIIRYEGNYKYSFGSLFFGTSVYLSPGKMTPNNFKENYSAQREGAKPSYVYATFNVDSVINLGNYLFWTVSSYFQISSCELMPIEQLSVGGVNTVRGYPENEVIGDKGLYVRSELRSSDFKLFHKDSLLQVVLFFDFAAVSDVDQNVLSNDSATLMSVGPGGRYSFKDNLSVKLDYGFQLKEVHGRYFGENISSQAHVSVNLEY